MLDRNFWITIRHHSFIRNAGIYTIGNVFNAAIPFLLMPVMTRYLTPEDYGVMAMLAVLIGLCTPFAGINLHGFVSVSFFKKRERWAEVISTAFGILVISLSITSIVAYICKEYIGYLFKFPVEWLWVVIFLCMSNFFITILLNVQQVQGNAKQYIFIQLSQTFINLILSLFLVIVLFMNWQGRIWAQVITGMIFMIWSAFLLKRWGLLKYEFSTDIAWEEIKFGIPLIPHALCGFFLIASDRVFISNMISLGDVGIYSVGYSLGQAIEILGISFNKAYSPWLYRKLRGFDLGTSNDRRKVVKFSYICISVFIIVAIVYSMCMPYFLRIFIGDKFQDAAMYIMGFSLASALNGVYYIMANYIFYQQKTKYLSMITFGSSLLHICISYMMIRWCGAIGASYAAVVTYMIIVIGTWWLSNKIYPMPWNLWKNPQ